MSEYFSAGDILWFRALSERRERLWLCAIIDNRYKTPGANALRVIPLQSSKPEWREIILYLFIIIIFKCYVEISHSSLIALKTVCNLNFKTVLELSYQLKLSNWDRTWVKLSESDSICVELLESESTQYL